MTRLKFLTLFPISVAAVFANRKIPEKTRVTRITKPFGVVTMLEEIKAAKLAHIAAGGEGPFEVMLHPLAIGYDGPKVEIEGCRVVEDIRVPRYRALVTAWTTKKIKYWAVKKLGRMTNSISTFPRVYDPIPKLGHYVDLAPPFEIFANVDTKVDGLDSIPDCTVTYGEWPGVDQIYVCGFSKLQ